MNGSNAIPNEMMNFVCQAQTLVKPSRMGVTFYQGFDHVEVGELPLPVRYANFKVRLAVKRNTITKG